MDRYAPHVTSPDDRAPMDPVFDGLFRPDEVADPVVEVRVEAAPVEAAPIYAPLADAAPVDAGPVNAPPVVESSLADTGRLFRSQGAQGHEDAVLAVEGRGRLRTLERTSSAEPDGRSSEDGSDPGRASGPDEIGRAHV